MTSVQLIHDTFHKGAGILRLIPNFVPRRFSDAGRRLRLHPDDYYALGMQRGSIKERWFSSVIAAMNGPLAPPDEGLSYVVPGDDIAEKFLFRDAVNELGAEIIGPELHQKYGTWPMYSKFFDYNPPLFFHLHLDDDRRRPRGAHRQARSLLFPAAAQQPSRPVPGHLFWHRSDGHERRKSARDCWTSRSATPASPNYRARSASAWAPAGIRRPACCTRPARI